MRLNSSYKEKIKFIFSVFVFMQIVIIIFYFKFGNIYQKPDLIQDKSKLNLYQQKLRYFKNVFDNLIPESEALLRGIRNDIVALLFLISKKLRISSSDLFKQNNLTNVDAENFLNHKAQTIAVVLIACNRSGVERTIKQIINYRPNSELWPLIVSQGCDDIYTKELIMKYRKHIYSFQINIPEINVSDVKPQFRGYYKISAHFKLALDFAFKTTSVDGLIVVEDDLDIAPDFFEYFSATYRLLKEDATLYCVSAFNDNGRPALINKDEYSTLYRTDFFPGLGWMLLRSTWLEIRKDWPLAFWDDYMRSLLIRRSRSCIRPEISRSSTFGQIGVSNGQFFKKYLQSIHLNDIFTNFSNLDLSYLYVNNFNSMWTTEIEEASQVDWHSLQSATQNFKSPVKIIYFQINELQEICDKFGLMSDLRDGIPRTAYNGVITFYWQSKRVFLVPAFTL